ncbi:TetR/AcrR family transcriptional regulator [Nocardioides rubriscoriae]|uniref:TetR/AcrR family transcriptional regulator n=1 Tax=Nocardioides rubriscoriae TaxID=642762 RepID=UPI0011DF46B4|nr:TetR/AcrR family transcriptional regulator [Nocardioides rubriscoriae]
MIKSAKRDRAATSQHITLCALRLTDEHGLDGFTMDDLAAAAEVSRRTLFNYFPGKLDAVLGEWPTLDDDDVDEFRAGGPAGDLLLDLRTLVLPLLGDTSADREMLAMSRRALRSNPRLMGAIHERYEAISHDVIDHVVAREGSGFGKANAKIAVTILAALFDASFDSFLDDPRMRPFAHHFDQSLTTARSLLGA